MKNLVTYILLVSAGFFAAFLNSNNQEVFYNIGDERVKHIKEAVVRIWIDTTPAATGFFVNEGEWIITNEHVVRAALQLEPTGKIVQKKDIWFETVYGEKIQALIMPSLLKQDRVHSFIYDYSILRPYSKPDSSFTSLEIGDWSSVNDGDFVYTLGYPRAIDQSVFATGVFSTKYLHEREIDIKGKDTKTVFYDAALLDITMNPGNSGGPLIKFGKSHKQDRVVGISSFILNPSAKKALDLIDKLENSRSDIISGGVSSKEVASLVAEVARTNSIGVSGCISIGYAKEILPTK